MRRGAHARTDTIRDTAAAPANPVAEVRPTQRSRRGVRTVARLVGLAVILTAILGATGCDPNEMATGSMALANRERAARGVPGLRWDNELAAKAARWADRMADTNTLSHSTITDGVSRGWAVLGENVGWGDDVEIVHKQFMNSPSHRDTMLNRSFSAVGIGVTVKGGKVWIAQVYKG